MMRKLITVPLAFERIVVEEIAPSLAEYGFHPRPSSPFNKNNLITFAREAKKPYERVEFGRAVYGKEQLQATDDVMERAPDDVDGTWVSCSRMYVQLVSNNGYIDLLTNGQVGAADGDDWWHFADEHELRLRLREVLPLLRTVALQWFDERRDDELVEQDVLVAK